MDIWASYEYYGQSRLYITCHDGRVLLSANWWDDSSKTRVRVQMRMRSRDYTALWKRLDAAGFWKLDSQTNPRRADPSAAVGGDIRFSARTGSRRKEVYYYNLQVTPPIAKPWQRLSDVAVSLWNIAEREQKRQALPARMERAARDAVALFVYPNIQPGEKWTAEDLAPFRPFKSARDDAKRWLLPMPERRLRETLEPVLKASRPGYPAYVGAAFILAYRGIDVAANARRISSGSNTFWPVLQVGTVVPSTPPVLAADRTYLTCRVSPDTIVYAIPDRLATVYMRHRIPAAIRVLINNFTDGCYGEYQSDVVSRLLLRYPASVLRAAAVDRQAAERVQWAVDSEHAGQNEVAMRKALKSVARTGGKREADLARKMLRKLDEYDARPK